MDNPAWPPSPLLFRRLSIIGSILGKLLYSDARTKRKDRLTYARICIEVLAEVVLKSSIVVKDDEGYAFEQDVIFEWKPSHCLVCKLQSVYSRVLSLLSKTS